MLTLSLTWTIQSHIFVFSSMFRTSESRVNFSGQIQLDYIIKPMSNLKFSYLNILKVHQVRQIQSKLPYINRKWHETITESALPLE